MDANMANPWKGLDSYKETDRLYGRDEEIEVLFSRIEYNTQTVVYSRSGIGKSSLLNAGIFPKARRAGFMPVSIRLQHSTVKTEPTAPYIEQIHQAVLEELLRNGGRVEEVVPHKDGHEETLWEYLHRHVFYLGEGEQQQQVIPMLVFDQFEEIFTLEKNVVRIVDFFAQVADLLNGVMPAYLTADDEAQDEEVHVDVRTNIFKGIKKRMRSSAVEYIEEDMFRVVFTLREDYLSYLERYTTRIPSMKMNRYCLLPITEEQAVTIIMEPCPGLVSREVARTIIEKITGETDFSLDGHPEIFVDSAILSLYLSRLYDMIPEGQQQITADLVNRFGDNIIQDFYAEAIEDVPAKAVEYMEDNLLNNEGRRENVSVYNAKHIGGLTDELLVGLSERRRLIRRFAYGGDMRIEYIHDILCPVILERRNNRQLMRIQEQERRNLLEKERAKRKRLEEKARIERKRYRVGIISGGVVLLLIVLSWIYHQYMNNWTCVEYYPSYALVNGWPVGAGERLSEKEAMRLAVSYKFIKKGHRQGSPFRMVEVMSPDGDLLHNKMNTPLVGTSEERDEAARRFLDLMNRTKYLKFSSTQLGDTAQATKYEALDAQNRVLYVVSFFSSVDDREQDDVSASEASYHWAVYTDAKGAPLQVRDNGADRMQVFLNAKGQEEKYMFFDGNSAPRQNDQGYYGYRVSYDELNRPDTLWVLDPFSEEEFMEVRGYGDHIEDYRCFDMEGKPIRHKTLQYHRRLAHLDERGNTIIKEYFDPDGGPVNDTVRSAYVELRYDEHNRLAYADDYDGARQPYTQNPHYYARREFSYIRNTLEKLNERDYRWDKQQQKMVMVRNYEAHLFGSVVEYTTINYERGEYRMKRVENNEDGDPVSVSYYGKDDKPAFDSIDNFHKHIIERHHLQNGQSIVVHRYYDADGSLYSAAGIRDYAIDSCVYSQRNLLLSRLCYNRDTVIVLSQSYEYKDGIEVSRYVKGVQGTPIRCPHWERDGLCYYVMKSVRSAQDALSYVKPISEYGCRSWAYDGDDPMGRNEHRGQQTTTNSLGSTWKKETVTTIYADHIPADAHYVMYVHLLRPNSLAEQLGLCDGDLLLDAGSWSYQPDASIDEALQAWEQLGRRTLALRVARYDRKRSQWQVHSFEQSPFRGTFGCEIYPVYYTDEEYEHVNKLLEQ